MNQTHDIRLTADGSIVEDMEIDEVYEGERDKQRCLIQEGGILFRTPERKRFFLKFSQFSFLFRRNPNVKAESK
jgi:hypothetical protein